MNQRRDSKHSPPLDEDSDLTTSPQSSSNSNQASCKTSHSQNKLKPTTSVTSGIDNLSLQQHDSSSATGANKRSATQASLSPTAKELQEEATMLRKIMNNAAQNHLQAIHTQKQLHIAELNRLEYAHQETLDDKRKYTQELEDKVLALNSRVTRRNKTINELQANIARLEETLLTKVDTIHQLEAELNNMEKNPKHNDSFASQPPPYQTPTRFCHTAIGSTSTTIEKSTPLLAQFGNYGATTEQGDAHVIVLQQALARNSHLADSTRDDIEASIGLYNYMKQNNAETDANKTKMFAKLKHLSILVTLGKQTASYSERADAATLLGATLKPPAPTTNNYYGNRGGSNSRGRGAKSTRSRPPRGNGRT